MKLNILKNVRKVGKVISPEGSFLELDFWIPELKLAFEFQEGHHYAPSSFTYHSLSLIQRRDFLKKQAIDDRGEKLIIVPYWWDGSSESLKSTIRLQRPDLFPSSVFSPISPEPPAGFLKYYVVPGIGEPMLPTFIFNATTEVSSWWISEKYDGIRGLWSNKSSKLYPNFNNYSRFANEIHLPQSNWIFSPVNLDGEFWCGRGYFDSAQSILNRSSYKDLENLRFVVFDSPVEIEGDNAPFESRLRSLLNSNLSFAPYIKSKGKKHLAKFMETIINDKGEGIVLRKPETIYDHGRSKNALKLKVHRDREALVLSVGQSEPLLQLPNGIAFTAPISELIRPRVGEIVSFTYSGIDPSSSLPISPLIHRIRRDVSWPDVCDGVSYASLAPSKVVLTEKALKQRKTINNPSGHWTHNENYNMRVFVDSYAKKFNFDPLDPQNWYNISRLEFVKEPGAGSVLAHYNSSLIRCLQDLYPDVEFDESKFKKKTSQYWHSSANRRRFLEEFAKSNNFDPLLPHNWYLYTRKDLVKGGPFLNYYKGSFIKAIVDVFPEVEFDEILFKRTKSRYWHDNENRKKFLKDFARKRGFNLNDASCWYTITQEDIIKEKGGISFLNQYGMSLRKSLLDLYPSIDTWSLHNFRQKRISSNAELTQYSSDKTKLRSFFDSLAGKLGFDPLVASNWYSLSKQHLKRSGVGIYILKRYQGSVASAVTDVYTELNLDASQFIKRRKTTN